MAFQFFLQLNTEASVDFAKIVQVTTTLILDHFLLTIAMSIRFSFKKVRLLCKGYIQFE